MSRCHCLLPVVDICGHHLHPCSSTPHPWKGIYCLWFAWLDQGPTPCPSLAAPLILPFPSSHTSTVCDTSWEVSRDGQCAKGNSWHVSNFSTLPASHREAPSFLSSGQWLVLCLAVMAAPYTPPTCSLLGTWRDRVSPHLISAGFLGCLATEPPLLETPWRD